ncbi:helix-hairpin-helix domain-containing protein [Oerskovia turbata]
MTDDRAAVPHSDLTPRIGKVATRELAHHGYTRYEDLTRATAEELLAIHGVGPKAVRILREELADRGATLQEP